MMGSLMYLTVIHLDLMFIVSLISRYMECPTKSHLLVVKRVLRYVKDMVSVEIFYKKGGSEELFEYTDNNYVGDQDDRKGI